MREALIERKVCAAARDAGWLVHPKTASGRRGWPDRTFTKPDRLVFVEFKAPGKRPTKLQRHIHATLKDQGYELHVIDTVETGIRLFAG